jgi:two-component sensor histidine kinase
MPELTGPTGSLPVAEMLDIMRLILRAEPPAQLLEHVTQVISKSFGVRRMVVCVLDESTGHFVPKAIHGYPVDKAAAIGRHTYTLEKKRQDLQPQLKVNPRAYYVRAEDQRLVCSDDLDYVMDPDAIHEPRATPTDWHEMDYIDFVMTDRLGNWVGWIEIDEPFEMKVPTKETIDRIQMLADLAAISIENTGICEEAISAVSESQSYIDLIVKDIGDMVGPLVFYLASIESESVLDYGAVDNARKAAAIAAAMRNLVDNVRKQSEVKVADSLSREKFDLRDVLMKCVSEVKRDFPTKDLVVSMDCPEEESTVMADSLIHDLFKNVINNAVRFDPKPLAEIDLSIQDNHGSWVVRIEDRGGGIPDDRKDKIVSHISKRPARVPVDGMGLSVVSQLVDRYNGVMRIKDRIPGDFSQGSCFEIALPKAPSAEPPTGSQPQEPSTLYYRERW